MADGGVLGFPVVDVRVECFDGKYHSVDSVGDELQDGRLARASRRPWPRPAPVLLEPISLVEVTVPADATRAT